MVPLTAFQKDMLYRLERGELDTHLVKRVARQHNVEYDRALDQMRGLPDVLRRSEGFGIEKRVIYWIDKDWSTGS